MPLLSQSGASNLLVRKILCFSRASEASAPAPGASFQQSPNLISTSSLSARLNSSGPFQIPLTEPFDLLKGKPISTRSVSGTSHSYNEPLRRLNYDKRSFLNLNIILFCFFSLLYTNSVVAIQNRFYLSSHCTTFSLLKPVGRFCSEINFPDHDHQSIFRLLLPPLTYKTCCYWCSIAFTVRSVFSIVPIRSQSSHDTQAYA